MSFTVIISGMLAVVSIAAAVHVLLTKRDSKAALAWVAFCLFLPLVGPLVYLVFGINRINTRAQRNYLANLEEDSSPAISEPLGTALRPLSLVGEQLTGHGLRSCDSIEVLENGEALYPAMLRDINKATGKIYFSTYIFDNDSTGASFIEALTAAKNRGVDVRIIVDGLGEFTSMRRIGRRLSDANLNYKRFNPITLIPPSLHVNMRNHRKILLIDSDVVFTGGQNIGDRHLVAQANNPKCTADLHFRLSGKIVDDFERAFLKDWHFCQGEKEIIAFEPSNPNLDQAEIWTRLIMDGPNENLDRLNELLVGTLSVAKKRIWIMTPYFLPGADLMGALLGAKLRGVDVKVFLPERINIPMAHWATQHSLPYIISKKISVYLQPAPFTYTKLLLIDDNYAMIGSANLDPRSLRLNFELGVEIFSAKLNQQLSQYVCARMDTAVKLDENTFVVRSFWKRIRNAVAWLFSPYL